MDFRKFVLVIPIIVLALAILPATQVFAASYKSTWFIYSTADNQKRPFAHIQVKYSLPDSATGSVDLDVSLTYVKDSQAYLSWIDFYNITVHLRSSPKGDDVAVSTSDTFHTRLNPGDQYSHKFSVRAAQTGKYLVILTWTTTDSGGKAYGYTIDPGDEITWDIGDDSDVSSIPKVSLQAQPVLTITLEPKDTITGNVIVDGQSLNITSGQVQFNLTLGQHSVQVPDQIDLGQGRRAIFQDWSDSDKSNPKQVSSDTDLALVAHYNVQYYLTVSSDFGNPQGAGWYDSGTDATFSVPQSSGILVTQVFDHWEGDSSANSASATVSMDAPKTVKAVWRTDYTQLLILAVVAVIAVVVVALLMRRRGTSAKAQEEVTPPRIEPSRVPAPIETAKTVEPAPKPSPPLAKNLKHCIHCGATIPAVVPFCTKCGKKQQ